MKIGEEEFKKAAEQSKGMGRAVGYLKYTYESFSKAGQAVFVIPKNYKDNYDVKFDEVIALRDKAVKDNKSVYFEKELSGNDIPKPDL